MKKKSNFLLVFAIIAAVVIGFLAGVAVDYPKSDKDEISGTIGKIKNYRNVKISEEDIQLQNDLVADTAMLKAIEIYFNFHYLKAVSLEEKIVKAVAESNANIEFKDFCGEQINDLDQFGEFLKNTRLELLTAVVLCNSAKESNPAVLRYAISQANNVISQINYKNSTVLYYLTQLDSFIQSKGLMFSPELDEVHDNLVFDELYTSAVINDKVVLKFFEDKKLYTKNEEEKSYKFDPSKTVLQDLQEISFVTSVQDQNLASDSFQQLQHNIGDVVSVMNLISDQMQDICYSHDMVSAVNELQSEGQIGSIGEINQAYTNLSSQILGWSSTTASEATIGSAQPYGSVANMTQLANTFKSVASLYSFNFDHLGITDVALGN